MGWNTAILEALNPNGPVPVLDHIMFSITVVGYTLILALLALSLRKWGKKREGLNLLFCLLVNAAIVKVLKNAIRSPRPLGAYTPFTNILSLPTSAYSFPSGHAATSAAFCVYLWLVFRKGHRTLLFPAALFLFAFLVSLSRLYLGYHYPTDVLAGDFLGVCLGYLFYHFLKVPQYRRALDILSSCRHRRG